MNLDLYLFEQFSETDSKPVTAADLLQQYKKYKQHKDSQQLTPETKELQFKEYKTGDGLQAYMKVMVAKENNGEAKNQAQKLLTLFGDTDKNIHEILTYLSQYASQHR